MFCNKSTTTTTIIGRHRDEQLPLAQISLQTLISPLRLNELTPKTTKHRQVNSTRDRRQHRDSQSATATPRRAAKIVESDKLQADSGACCEPKLYQPLNGNMFYAKLNNTSKRSLKLGSTNILFHNNIKLAITDRIMNISQNKQRQAHRNNQQSLSARCCVPTKATSITRRQQYANINYCLQLLALLMVTLFSCQLPTQTMSIDFQAGGGNLCPLSSQCSCKTSSNKVQATCEKKNILTIPNNLPEDTQVLALNGNNLRELTQYAFQERRLTNLQKLFLSECKISFIADEAFVQLTNLVELDLSHNQLHSIPVKSFERLEHSLRKLSLAHNPIQTIERDSFSSLAQLTTLDLSNCQLSLVKPSAFFGLNQLKELKLHDNRLTQLPSSALVEANEYLNLDLYSNPWHCDCELRQTIDWMSRHRIQQSIMSSCATPKIHKDIRWTHVRAEEFICPPVVVNRQNELIVGVGSNVSLPCEARGSAPLTFVWFQDEKNLTNPRNGAIEPPASTKLLDEKRYEIVEGIESPGNPNVTTSILYLLNLKLTDTSLFLCWVENPAGYVIANFSLVVSADLPPMPLPGSQNEGSAYSFWRLFPVKQEEAQLAIVALGFVILLALAIVFLLMFKRTIMSTEKPAVQRKQQQATGGATGAHKYGNSNQSSQNNSRSTLTADDDTDQHSSASSSSCRKGLDPKMMAPGDVDGFIEHLRSGIINMDYHSMSPVIQFNNMTNTLRGTKVGNAAEVVNQQQQQQKQQQLGVQYHPAFNRQQQQQKPVILNHHFTSGSNASSVPYYPTGNGSASMATTTSDLSPGSGAYQASFVGSAMGSAVGTKCDLPHHQLGEMVAPGANNTTASYTSELQSGYGDEPSMAPIYHHQQIYQMQNPHQQQVYNPQQAGNLQSMLRAQKQQQQQHHLSHQQAPIDTLSGALLMQDLIQNRMLPGGGGGGGGGSMKRGSHYNPEFHIL